MRLSGARVQNFKKIEDVTIHIPPTDSDRAGSGEFLSIIGENNVGKSSLLESLELALPGTDFTTPDIDHFPGREQENGPIIVELTFEDLSDEDRQKRGIRTHVYEDQFRLKKEWSEVGSSPQYFAYQPSYDVGDWWDNRTRRTFIEENDQEEAEVRRIVEIYENREEEIDYLNSDIRQELKAIAIEENSPILERGPPDWQPNPGGIKSNVDSALPGVIKVPAIHDPEEETTTDRKSSAVGAMIDDVIENHLIEHPVVEEFRQSSKDVQEIFKGEEKDEQVVAIESQISKKLRRVIDVDAQISFNPPDVTQNLAGGISFTMVFELGQSTRATAFSGLSFSRCWK